MSLPEHLNRIKTLTSQVMNLPAVLTDLSHLPPGDSSEGEARELLAALSSLNVHRDGTSLDPAAQVAEQFVYALESGTKPAADALRLTARSILYRLDQLARQGVRPPDSVLAADFKGEVEFLRPGDNPEGPVSAWGLYDALDPQHPLRSQIKREDCYEHAGRRYVFLGCAITGENETRPLPWLPIREAIRGTLLLSTPQRQSRQALKDQEEADREARRQAFEDGKSVYTRILEAKLAARETAPAV